MSAFGDLLEIFHMLDAKSLFSQAVRESRQSVDEGGALELDFVDTYPNIPKQHVLQALREGLTAIQKCRQNRSPVQYCAVSRLNRKQDRLGTGASLDFISVLLEAVEQHVQYELFVNAYFLVGSWILEQTERVPIGGPTSAKCAVLYMIMKEPEKLRTGLFQWRFLQSRYRDNLNFVLVNRRNCRSRRHTACKR